MDTMDHTHLNKTGIWRHEPALLIHHAYEQVPQTTEYNTAQTRTPSQAAFTQLTDTVGDRDLFKPTPLQTRNTDPLKRRTTTKCHTAQTRAPLEAAVTQLTDTVGDTDSNNAAWRRSESLQHNPKCNNPKTLAHRVAPTTSTCWDESKVLSGLANRSDPQTSERQRFPHRRMDSKGAICQALSQKRHMVVIIHSKALFSRMRMPTLAQVSSFRKRSQTLRSCA